MNALDYIESPYIGRDSLNERIVREREEAGDRAAWTGRLDQRELFTTDSPLLLLASLDRQLETAGRLAEDMRAVSTDHIRDMEKTVAHLRYAIRVGG